MCRNKAIRGWKAPSPLRMSRDVDTGQPGGHLQQAGDSTMQSATKSFVFFACTHVHASKGSQSAGLPRLVIYLSAEYKYQMLNKQRI